MKFLLEFCRTGLGVALFSDCFQLLPGAFGGAAVGGGVFLKFGNRGAEQDRDRAAAAPLFQLEKAVLCCFDSHHAPLRGGNLVHQAELDAGGWMPLVEEIGADGFERGRILKGEDNVFGREPVFEGVLTGGLFTFRGARTCR